MANKIKLTNCSGYFEVVPIHNNGKLDNDRNPCFVQSDWDFPGLASDFGFIPCPDCGKTDGTVDCEHKTASQMIAEAREFLDDNIGKIIDDPGYCVNEK